MLCYQLKVAISLSTSLDKTNKEEVQLVLFSKTYIIDMNQKQNWQNSTNFFSCKINLLIPISILDVLHTKKIYAMYDQV